MLKIIQKDLEESSALKIQRIKVRPGSRKSRDLWALIINGLGSIQKRTLKALRVDLRTTVMMSLNEKPRKLDKNDSEKNKWKRN